MQKKKKQIPELLVGIRNFSSAIAAVNNGADAIYFGVKGFNMRDLGENFSLNGMKKLVSYLHENKVKAYLALNTIIYEEEISKVEKVLKKAKEAQIDAVILWDFSVLALAKKLKLKIFLSTQASVSNSLALKQYSKLGVKRIILARELSLEQIKKISLKAKKIGIEIEVFVHGAMCISISGRCFLSHDLFGRSANRGECLQPCRRAFFLDGDKPNYKKKEIHLQGNTILSAKDMKTIDFLDKIIESRVTSIKIEGRTKPSDYIATVTRCYKEALENIAKKTFSKTKIAKWNKELEKVYNRKFSTGFFLNKPTKKDLANIQGSNQTTKRVNIGVVKKFYVKPSVAEIKLFADTEVNNDLVFEGVTTFLEQKLSSMEINHKQIKRAGKGDLVGIKTIERVRMNDKVFKVVETKKTKKKNLE